MSRTRTLAFMLLVGVLISQAGADVASGQTGPTSGAAKQFVGTWRLVSIAGGTPEQNANRGPSPTGLIYYDAAGNMAVQIMPSRPRPKYDGQRPTPTEAQDAIRGYTAYFGTYTVDEGARTVTHHRKGNLNPGLLGDFTRRFEFAPGDRLILSPVESTTHLTWERVK